MEWWRTGVLETRLHYSTTPFFSSPNTTHRAKRRDKLRFPDVMSGLFLPNHFLEPIGYLLVRAPITQPRAKVVLSHAEEARSYFTIGRQPEPITMAAEG